MVCTVLKIPKNGYATYKKNPIAFPPQTKITNSVVTKLKNYIAEIGGNKNNIKMINDGDVLLKLAIKYEGYNKKTNKKAKKAGVLLSDYTGHQTDVGAYIIALTINKVAFGINPTTVSYVPSSVNKKLSNKIKDYTNNKNTTIANLLKDAKNIINEYNQ